MPGTRRNPFKSMMQAWKYSLPAFLVPFLFAASKEGANLLILDASLPGFILPCINSTLCLFFLSVGIIGYLKGRFNVLARAALIVAACIMTFDPIDFYLSGLAPAVVGCGNVSGRRVDKLARFGPTPVPASRVAAPLVAEDSQQALVFGEGLGVNAALVITRAFGLRALANLQPLAAGTAAVRPWEGWKAQGK